MSWNDCRWRSQTRLRRAPFTGRQQAKREKTASGLLLGPAALRDRLAEAPADVARGAVGTALDEPQDRGAAGARVQVAVDHRRQLLPFDGEAREDVFGIFHDGTFSASALRRSSSATFLSRW